MNSDSENTQSEATAQDPVEMEEEISSEPAVSAPERIKRAKKSRAGKKSRKILVVDVGGTHVKILATGQKERREAVSGPKLTAAQMVRRVKNLVKDWKYDAVTIGYPGPVVHGKPLRDPHNLGPGWVKFNYSKAFGRPVRIINDAAMQALGSYKRGRMLFLGLGTGLGSAMIANSILQPMEVAHLPYKRGTYEDYLGLRGLEHLGKKKWRREVAKVVNLLRDALEADQVVLGGGNACRMKKLPAKTTLGDNNNAFLGGFRVWEDKGITLGT
jgi:predicted NBD/HSP70 family sugar kinase